jgi:hypothetical protein
VFSFLQIPEGFSFMTNERRQRVREPEEHLREIRQSLSSRVAQLPALGGVRAGDPLRADAGPPRRGAGYFGRLPNPPGGCVVGVNPIRRQF